MEWRACLCFLCEYGGLIAPNTEQYWFTVTHTEPPDCWEKWMPKFFPLSFASLSFYRFAPVCFTERDAVDFQGRSFMLTGQLWPVYPFYSQSLQGLEDLRIHSHRQMNWGNNTQNWLSVARYSFYCLSYQANLRLISLIVQMKAPQNSTS